ncbi:MAG: glutaredoxin 3 [Pseudomonadota bacterium]
MAKVEIYTSLLCGYCHRAKALLTKKGVEFVEYDLMAQPGKRAEMLERSAGRTSVPQIFIDEQHIGGSDDLYDLERRGGLDPLLRKAA